MKLTLGDLLRRFKDTECPKRRGGHNDTIIIAAVLDRDIARVPLSALTKDEFAKYRDMRLKAIKPGTLLRELGLVQSIIERARHDWGIPLPENPLKGLRKPKADKGRDRRLREGEWERLTEALGKSRNEHLRPLVELALETAMRRGELLNIHAGDFDRAARTLHIPKTKTDQPRTIPLTPRAFELLETLAADKKAPDPLFQLTCEAVKQGWMRLTKRAGIEDLNFHDLRHEAISRFFEQDLSIPEVALISGHKDPRMLFRYTHLRAEDVAKKLQGGT